jgi:SAM-dependent methyltransferase
LLDYFNAHKEGPGLWKSHHYFEIYHRHFQKFIGKQVNVLEVGIYSGGSLGMWREYFGKNCHIYGTDIEPACMAYKSDGIDVFIGDQSDRNFWKKFRETVPKIDILIDDGGHHPEQQRITLEEMLPHLQPGGVYLCEDIWDIGSRATCFGGFVSGLVCCMNGAKRETDDFHAPVIPSGFQASVRSVIQYPYVTVIEKHDQNPGLFITTKHGTEWQPY